MISEDKYVTTVVEDSSGDLVLVFPDKMMEAMDWNFGYVLNWYENDDGSWTLTKNAHSDSQ